MKEAGKTGRLDLDVIPVPPPAPTPCSAGKNQIARLMERWNSARLVRLLK